MNGQFKYLFSPIKIGPVTVKNRIYFGPHETMLSDNDNLVDERYVEYIKTRAKGGAGLIYVGNLTVMFNSRCWLKMHEGYDERTVPMLKQMAKVVHEEGAKLFLQLAHKGRDADMELTRLPTWSASALPSPTFRTVPKEMEIEDIKEVVKAFARVAGFAREAGCDGLELHGSGGYLVDQFISPCTNKRKDEYGGSLENRLRFPIEIYEAIRKTVGSDFALGIRISNDDLVPGGNTFDDMKQVAQKLEETGLFDFIHAGFSPAFGFLLGFGMQVPLGSYGPYAAGFKEVVELPILFDQRINDPVQAEKILADGQGDMVGMVRALMADPELPNKAREGRFDEIRPCIACSQGCFGRVFLKSKTVACLQNAASGREKEIGTLEPAKLKKKVLVVGGGPAGMETARVAELRGHEVVLYEKEKELGGQVNIAVKVPIRQEFGGITRYLAKQMEILGVKVNLGVEVAPELIKREKPDAVVIATGSLPSKNTFPGADQDNVVSVWDVLQEKVKVGDNVVVVDEGEAHWQCLGTAEYLADQGKKVEIVTPLLFVGMEILTTLDLSAYYIRMRAKGVVFSPHLALMKVSGRMVIVKDVYDNTERRIEGIDTVVMATFNQANDQLYQSLKGKVKELHRVGDCVAPRKAMDAISDGYNLGRVL